MTNPDDESEAVADGVRQFLENENVRVTDNPNPRDDSFTFLYDGKPLLTIMPNGRIIPREMFTTNEEASLKFWQIVMEVSPQFRHAMFRQYLLDFHLSAFKL